ncbi:MAG: GerMN domain-containing protein [Thermodesulfovibrio sp.]|nr:GerMN domain-containing protein [Thermodesulfovibrio sp.]
MKKKKIIIILILMVIALTTFIIFIISKEEKNQKVSKKEPELENFKVFLYQNNDIIKKEIYLSKENNELRKIERVLENFISNLRSPLDKTKIIGIYRDKTNKVYLDLSSNFSVPMDAKEEFYLLKSLYLTLKTNFIWISDVKILLSSSEKETLAGHILIDSLKESVEES